MFISRLDSLIKSNDLTRKEFLEKMEFGKNQITYWEKNHTLPNPSTLSKIATFFGVSVEYLKGVENDEDYTIKIVGFVVEWLIDNDYEYSEDETGIITIEKDGDFLKYSSSDFAEECMRIKKVSEKGFELAMKEWERQTFTDNSRTNIINDSPNATLIVNDPDLSKQELELIKMYRDFSLEDQLALITYALKLKNGEV